MANARATQAGRTVQGFVDIGTAKTACLIVDMSAPGRPKAVLGAGISPTRGLKAGVVVEMDGVEQAVRDAVGAAEGQANLTLDAITLAVACGRMRAHTFAAEAAIQKYTVSAQDIDKLMQAGKGFAEKDGRLLITLNRLQCRVDGTACDGEPNGLAGRMLGADLVAVTADEPPIHNLMHVVDRAHLDTARLVPAPLASGLAATTPQDRQQGVVCVDIGAGTTQISVFAQGHLLVADVVPVGGNHITFDIARALSATILEAERIKKDYGTLARRESVLSQVVAYAGAGTPDAPPLQTTAGVLCEIIEARVMSVLAHIAERLQRLDGMGLGQYARRQMIVTGGTSRLPGLVEMAAAVFGRPVQVGSVCELPGMPADMAGPEFATVAGMALALPGYDLAAGQAENVVRAGGVFGRMGRWLRHGS